jgi:ketosteroid isomerase-like protein
MTPEEFLSSFVKEFNAGDIDSLLMLYETDACTVSQIGQVVTSQNNIRQSLQGFIDMKGKLENKVKRVIQTSNLALVISEWSFKGTGHDGNPVNFIGKSTDVLRQQSDGS